VGADIYIYDQSPRWSVEEARRGIASERRHDARGKRRGICDRPVRASMGIWRFANPELLIKELRSFDSVHQNTIRKDSKVMSG
jgi:hypothetical protein